MLSQGEVDIPGFIKMSGEWQVIPDLKYQHSSLRLVSGEVSTKDGWFLEGSFSKFQDIRNRPGVDWRCTLHGFARNEMKGEKKEGTWICSWRYDKGNVQMLSRVAPA